MFKRPKKGEKIYYFPTFVTFAIPNGCFQPCSLGNVSNVYIR